MTPLRIFIGYDAREAVAYQVLTHSILRRASAPVTFCPIVRGHLGKVYTRERGPLESTDFSITRFLVPWLSGYDGISIFMDCDFLCLADIHDLGGLTATYRLSCGHGVRGLAGRDPTRDGIRCRTCGTPKAVVGYEEPAVWVCKHDYVPKAGSKMGGQIQTAYQRKNWSSLMVFDNAKCSALTPEYVNTASGLDLHRFAWASDAEIGSLPLEWNWLVGEYPPNPEAKMLHYTLGGVWHGRSESGLPWTSEYREMTGTLSFQGAGVR